MQPLNLRSPQPYDFTDESETLKPRAVFYCISEGPTEESYFNGIKNTRTELNIKNDVFIEILPKEEGQETYSHPEQLVYGCLRMMGRIDCENNELSEAEYATHCVWENYDPDVDNVCVIFDRDYRGLESKISGLLELCKKHNIFVAMSNPNFEFWLLMHFPNIEGHDREMLLKNPKNLRGVVCAEASKDKKYLEIQLSKIADGYKKGCKIKFEKYFPGIELALAQSKLFSEEPEVLVDELGTSVGKLIRRMQEI